MQSLLTKAQDKYGLPSIAVTLMNSGAIYLQEIVGTRVIAQSDLVTLNDYYHIGSCSKSVLSVMAAKLIEQGKIGWQTPFFEVFPEFLQDARPDYAEITLEDLMLCRAGILAFTNADKESLPDFDASVSNKRQAFIRYLLKQPPASEKSECKFKQLYSNASYTMASAMLERVSGLSYEQLVKFTLEEGMNIPVHIGWPHSISPEQPWGHIIKSKTEIEIMGPRHDYVIPELLTPAGDLSMTSIGFANYTQLHLKGLRKEDNYISSQSYENIHFGYKGFSLGVGNGRYRNTRYSGMDGSAGTFFCRSIIVPESDFAFTLMINAASNNGTSAAAEWLTQKILVKQFNLNFWERFLLKLVG
jgi:CubicO group peptidase (beta-lactamase class C family)